MKQLLVGGGFVDFATLHPLWTVMLALVGLLVTRRAVRAFGPGRHSRMRRPPRRGESEGPRPATGLL